MLTEALYLPIKPLDLHFSEFLLLTVMQTFLCFLHILSGVTIHKIRKQIYAMPPLQLKIWLLGFLKEKQSISCVRCDHVDPIKQEEMSQPPPPCYSPRKWDRTLTSVLTESTPSSSLCSTSEETAESSVSYQTVMT